MVNQTVNYIGTFYSIMMTIRIYQAYFIIQFITCKMCEQNNTGLFRYLILKH